MFVSQAYAQAAGGAGGLGGFDIMSILPLVLIFVVFYFLLIRPQQKKMKEHRALIESIKRGDTVTLGGGMIGKVARVVDEQIVEVDIADNVRVKVVRGTITDVRGKGEAPKEETKTDKSDKADKSDKDEKKD